MNSKFKYDGTYKTAEQLRLGEAVEQSTTQYQVIIAPTSYGKTELILTFIENNRSKKICIITPTKALAAQTKKRIINHFNYKKVITYPEMFCSSDEHTGFVAVLTQERLLRLLQNEPSLKFDILVIDEAHELMNSFSDVDSRSVILGVAIIICHKRNMDLICKYLTPFLKSGDNLRLKYIAGEIKYHTVMEYVKSETLYFYDLGKNTKSVLDQYSTKKEKLIVLEHGKQKSDSDIIIENCDNKNIVYLNRPIDVESFAEELSTKTATIGTEKFKKAAQDLKGYIHEDYKLANCVEHGVIYHHGAIPEPVRYFIKDLYCELTEAKVLIVNSTLLEGVNLSATKMFILDLRRGRQYLSPSSFRNCL